MNMDPSRRMGCWVAALCFVSAAVLTTPAASANWALGFDGVDDYAAVRDLTFSYSSLTIEVWVYRLGDGSDEIVGMSIHPDNVYFQLELDNGTGLLFDPAGSDCRLQNPHTLVPYAQWCHIAAVYDHPDVFVYVNGVPRLDSTWGNSIDISGVDLIIGKEVPEEYDFWHWHGYIDELRIWTVGRSHSEILDWMHHELSGSEPGLLGYWQFNEGEGQTIHDRGPDALHGHRGSSWDTEDSDPDWVPGVAIASPVEGGSWATIKAMFR